MEAVATDEEDMEAPDDPTWTPSGKRAPTHRRLPCQKKIKTRYAYPDEPSKRRKHPGRLPSHRPLALHELRHPEGGYRLVYRRTDPDRWYGALNRKGGMNRVYVKSPFFMTEEDAARWVLAQLNETCAA